MGFFVSAISFMINLLDVVHLAFSVLILSGYEGNQPAQVRKHILFSSLEFMLPWPWNSAPSFTCAAFWMMFQIIFCLFAFVLSSFFFTCFHLSHLSFLNKIHCFLTIHCYVWNHDSSIFDYCWKRMRLKRIVFFAWRARFSSALHWQMDAILLQRIFSCRLNALIHVLNFSNDIHA